MSKIIDCLVNIFGAYDRVNVTSELVYSLMKKLGDYKVLPNAVNEMVIGFENGMPKQQTIERMQFISKENSLIINIAGNTISVKKTETTGDGIDISKFVEDSKIIVEALINELKINGERIALVATLQGECKPSIYDSLIVENDYFKSDELVEWSLRRVKREKQTDLGADEVTNLVVNVNVGNFNIANNITHQNLNIDATLYTLDFNTVPENRNARIDSDYASRFLDIAIKKINEAKAVVVHDSKK